MESVEIHNIGVDKVASNMVYLDMEMTNTSLIILHPVRIARKGSAVFGISIPYRVSFWGL